MGQVEGITTKKPRCAFCEEYKRLLGIGEVEKQHGYALRLRACIFSHSTNRAGKEHYSTYSKPMKLKFCPSCGRELNSLK